MSDSIITGLIAAAASVICQLIISHRGKKERSIKEAVKEQKLNDRLESIEKKLDVHNGYAEKLGGIQTSIAVIETEIKHLKAK